MIVVLAIGGGAVLIFVFAFLSEIRWQFAEMRRRRRKRRVIKW